MSDVIYRNFEEIESVISDLRSKAQDFAEQSQFGKGNSTNPTYSQSDTVSAMRYFDTYCHTSFNALSSAANSLATFLEKDVLAIQKADNAAK